MTQEELINQNKVLEGRLAKAKEVFRNMTAEQETLKKRVAELEAAATDVQNCDELTSTVEDLTDKLNAALEDTKKYVEEIHEKDVKIASLTEAVNANTTYDAAKNDKIVELTERLDNAKAVFADDKKKYNELAERFDKLTVEHKELKAQADDAVSERDNQIKSLEAALATATSQSKKYIAEYGTLADHVKELTNKNEALVSEAEERNAVISDLEVSISDLQEEVKILKNKNTHLNEKLADYTNKLPQIKENLTKEVEEMQVKTKKLQENLVSNFNIFG